MTLKDRTTTLSDLKANSRQRTHFKIRELVVGQMAVRCHAIKVRLCHLCHNGQLLLEDNKIGAADLLKVATEITTLETKLVGLSKVYGAAQLSLLPTHNVPVVLSNQPHFHLMVDKALVGKVTATRRKNSTFPRCQMKVLVSSLKLKRTSSNNRPIQTCHHFKCNNIRLQRLQL